MQISAIIPTLNAAHSIEKLLLALQRQTVPMSEIIVVDSSSQDGTAALAQKCGARILSIPQSAFDHGGTRDYALRNSAGDIVLFFTQDALPVNDEFTAQLLHPFSDPQIAAVTGRQLPWPSARPYVQEVQAYRYPAQSRLWTKADIPRLGLEAFHLSDVCAAYRRSAYLAVGGFHSPLMTNEDMLIASCLLDGGYRLAYCAEATVYHSHSFTLAQEYARNLQIGRFMCAYADRLGDGHATGEGVKMVKHVLRQLARKGEYAECISFCLDCAARLCGSYAGRRIQGKQARAGLSA